MSYTNHASIKEHEIRNPVRFCPCCGESLRDPKSLLNVFTEGQEFVYFCWCRQCSWRGEIMSVTRVTAPELSSDR
jgi:C4-type Zn-finger protein